MGHGVRRNGASLCLSYHIRSWSWAKQSLFCVPFTCIWDQQCLPYLMHVVSVGHVSLSENAKYSIKKVLEREEEEIGEGILAFLGAEI